MPVSSKIGDVFYPDAKKDYKTISFAKDPAGILRVSEFGHVIMGRRAGFFSFSMQSLEENKELPKIISVEFRK